MTPPSPRPRVLIRSRVGGALVSLAVLLVLLALGLGIALGHVDALGWLLGGPVAEDYLDQTRLDGEGELSWSEQRIEDWSFEHLDTRRGIVDWAARGRSATPLEKTQTFQLDAFAFEDVTVTLQGSERPEDRLTIESAVGTAKFETAAAVELELGGGPEAPVAIAGDGLRMRMPKATVRIPAETDADAKTLEEEGDLARRASLHRFPVDRMTLRGEGPALVRLDLRRLRRRRASPGGGQDKKNGASEPSGPARELTLRATGGLQSRPSRPGGPRVVELDGPVRLELPPGAVAALRSESRDKADRAPGMLERLADKGLLLLAGHARLTLFPLERDGAPSGLDPPAALLVELTRGATLTGPTGGRPRLRARRLAFVISEGLPAGSACGLLGGPSASALAASASLATPRVHWLEASGKLYLEADIRRAADDPSRIIEVRGEHLSWRPDDDRLTLEGRRASVIFPEERQGLEAEQITILQTAKSVDLVAVGDVAAEVEERPAGPETAADKVRPGLALTAGRARVVMTRVAKAAPKSARESGESGEARPAKETLELVRVEIQGELGGRPATLIRSEGAGRDRARAQSIQLERAEGRIQLGGDVELERRTTAAAREGRETPAPTVVHLRAAAAELKLDPAVFDRLSVGDALGESAQTTKPGRSKPEKPGPKTPDPDKPGSGEGLAEGPGLRSVKAAAVFGDVAHPVIVTLSSPARDARLSAGRLLWDGDSGVGEAHPLAGRRLEGESAGIHLEADVARWVDALKMLILQSQGEARVTLVDADPKDQAPEAPVAPGSPKSSRISARRITLQRPVSEAWQALELGAGPELAITLDGAVEARLASGSRLLSGGLSLDGEGAGARPKDRTPPGKREGPTPKTDKGAGALPTITLDCEHARIILLEGSDASQPAWTLSEARLSGGESALQLTTEDELPERRATLECDFARVLARGERRVVTARSRPGRRPSLTTPAGDALAARRLTLTQDRRGGRRRLQVELRGDVAGRRVFPAPAKGAKGADKSSKAKGPSVLDIAAPELTLALDLDAIEAAREADKARQKAARAARDKAAKNEGKTDDKGGDAKAADGSGSSPFLHGLESILAPRGLTLSTPEGDRLSGSRAQLSTLFADADHRLVELTLEGGVEGRRAPKKAGAKSGATTFEAGAATLAVDLVALGREPRSRRWRTVRRFDAGPAVKVEDKTLRAEGDRLQYNDRSRRARLTGTPVRLLRKKEGTVSTVPEFVVRVDELFEDGGMTDR